MQDETEDKKMPLLDHLVELRQRLLYSAIGLLAAFLGCFFVADTLFSFMNAPLASIWRDFKADAYLIYTGPTEVFFTYVKVALFFGFMISFPIMEIQIWRFVAPGLYRNEKRVMFPFLFFTPVMFAIGFAFNYMLVLPLALKFFMTFQTLGSEASLGIQFQGKVSEYSSLFMQLSFAFGLCFQLPVVMTMLARAGVASSAGMKAKRRHAILGVFVFAAIFTPPDPLSMIALAIPIALLYEVSIHLAALIEKKRDAEEEEERKRALDD